MFVAFVCEGRCYAGEGSSGEEAFGLDACVCKGIRCSVIRHFNAVSDCQASVEECARNAVTGLT